MRSVLLLSKNGILEVKASFCNLPFRVGRTRRVFGGQNRSVPARIGAIFFWLLPLLKLFSNGDRDRESYDASVVGICFQQWVFFQQVTLLWSSCLCARSADSVKEIKISTKSIEFCFLQPFGDTLHVRLLSVTGESVQSLKHYLCKMIIILTRMFSLVLNNARKKSFRVFVCASFWRFLLNISSEYWE